MPVPKPTLRLAPPSRSPRELVADYAERAARDLLSQARGVAPTADDRAIVRESMQTYLACRLQHATAAAPQRRRLELRMRAALDRVARVDLGVELDARSRAAAAAERWAAFLRDVLWQGGLLALDALL